MDDVNPYQSPLTGPDDEPELTDARPFDGVIRLKLGNSQQAYAVGVALATSQTWNRWFTAIEGNWFRVAVVLFFLAAFYSIDRAEPLVIAICGAMGVVGVGLWLWKLSERRHAWRRYYQYIAERYHNVDQYFDERGLHINGDDMTNFFGWTRFDGFRTELPRSAGDQAVIVVYQDFPDHYQIYSRDSLEVPEHWADFVAMLGAHLQRR